MEQKVVLFNGPPGCGKDYAANFLFEETSAWKFSFKEMVENILRSVYCIPERGEEDLLWYWGSTQEEKAKPRKELGGMSYRQALIDLSENVIKPHFGKDWIARKTVEKVSGLYKYFPLLVCSDLGFQEEFDACVNKWGVDNVHLVVLHRKGHSFEGDSRSYVEKFPEGFCNLHIIRNCGTEEFDFNLMTLTDYCLRK